MKCPFCGKEDTRVIDSRSSDDCESIRRRRICEACGKRFTTYERLEMIPVMVIKKDSRRVPFDREKIEAGLVRALHKRPVSVEKIRNIADSIENRIFSSGEREISSQKIGEMVLSVLKETDQVAYIRFASVYRDFDDVNTFIEEIKKLKGSLG